MDLHQPPTCLFRRELDTIWQQVQTSPLDVTDVFDLSERLVAAFQDPSRCEDGCSQSLDYTQTLLESVARLQDVLDVAWSAAHSDDENNGSRSAMHFGHAVTNGSASTTSTVVGQHATATVGRFVLDESDRDLLLQEVLRASMVSMNDVVAEVHHRISQNSRAASDLERLGTLSARLLERTYSALARYGTSTRA